MNRKQFLGTLVGSIIAIPTLFGMTSIKNNITPPIDPELQDLYDYLENQTINTLIKGKIPFQLYPYQKQILKQIHENDKIIIVKARQIGMTTLLAGYIAWRYSRTNNRYSFNDIIEKYRSFSLFNSLKYHFINENYVIRTADELNQFKDPYCGLMSNINKNIIVGTPDFRGNLKQLVYKKEELGFKVFTYTVDDCSEVWDSEKIDRFRVFTKNSNVINRELYCQFI